MKKDSFVTANKRQRLENTLLVVEPEAKVGAFAYVVQLFVQSLWQTIFSTPS
jgi:hypothetical protein